MNKQTSYCTLFVFLALSNHWCNQVAAKHLPDVEFISQLKGIGNSDLYENMIDLEESGFREDYFRQTYGNIPIGDPLKDYDVDIGSPLSEQDLAYQTKFPGGPDGAPRDDLGVDPITLAGLYQGDIVINSRDELRDLTSVVLRSAVSYDQRLWPNGIIPYTISSTFDDRDRSEIARSMAAFQSQTCLTFVPRKGHADYIHIYRGQGCSSSVGRQSGRQGVSIGNGCMQYGTILHELMHAAGFWHEQSRYDRDDYVTIVWDNIRDGLAYNFDKNNQGSTASLGLSYDYNSLMHYGANAFAKDRRYPTIIPKQEGVSIGNRRDFSKLDIKGLNLLYTCTKKPVPPTKPITTTTTTTTTTPKPNPGKICKDKNSNCKKWSSYGYCKTYSTYMNKNCQKSCSTCDTENKKCQDRNPSCGWWAENKECERNPSYMLSNCLKSCGRCG